ncbi:MAG: PEP-CTERM sorting domain-containing protein [Verrucomicrobia bacterium]|nr:PEP-CTERM sorting domain-containing protein [Verrucomicrobiota bacterium]MCH8527045.1 PEP-CTERM sorting domain-containing protein [Kiritimatiellia bacterium]
MNTLSKVLFAIGLGFTLTAQSAPIIINNANGDDNTFNLEFSTEGTVYRADFEDLPRSDAYRSNVNFSQNAYRASRTGFRDFQDNTNTRTDRTGFFYLVNDLITEDYDAPGSNIALGFLNQTEWFGLHVTNTSGSTIAGFELDFTAVLRDQNAAQVYSFEYSIDGGTFTQFSDLNFGGTNTTENNPLTLSATLPNSSLADGESLFIRWNNNRTSSNDGVAGFDEINLTVIPEPGTLAMIGIAALAGLIGFRRRR